MEFVGELEIVRRGQPGDLGEVKSRTRCTMRSWTSTLQRSGQRDRWAELSNHSPGIQPVDRTFPAMSYTSALSLGEDRTGQGRTGLRVIGICEHLLIHFLLAQAYQSAPKLSPHPLTR